MKAAVARKPVIKIAVVESDPLRFVGFRALFDAEPEFELVSASLPEISTLQGIDLILLGNRNGQNLFDVMASLKATRPDLKIIVTGSGIDEETILKAIASGAKGYVDEAAPPSEFAQNSVVAFAAGACQASNAANKAARARGRPRPRACCGAFATQVGFAFRFMSAPGIPWFAPGNPGSGLGANTG